MPLRLKSVFCVKGSGLEFHVATCKRSVFTQYSSILSKPNFSQQLAESGHNTKAAIDQKPKRASALVCKEKI